MNTVESKKRKRLIRLCHNCRDRKVKCNLQRPRCSSCLEKGLSDCIYFELPEQSKEDYGRLVKENDQLKSKIRDLESIISYKDREIDLEKYQLLKGGHNKTFFCGVTSMNFVFQGYQLNSYYNLFKVPLKAPRKDWKKINNVKFPEKGYRDINEVLVDVEKQLNNYRMIEETLNLFFNGYWGRHLPICDEREVMGFFRDHFREMKEGLRINVDDQDALKLALVLSIVKIVKPEEKLESFVMRLLEFSKYTKNVTLSVLQSLILIRTVKKFDPKDGDEGDGSGSNILLSISLEMAFSLGLHQNIDTLYKDSDHIVVLKNIWKVLLYQDSINSFQLGVPLHISNFHLRQNLLDMSDPLVKVIMVTRKVVNTVSNTATIGQIEMLIEDVKLCLEKYFRSPFATIQELQSVKNLDRCFLFIEEFYLANDLIAMMQYLYTLLFYEFKGVNTQQSTRAFNIGVKYSIIAIVSSVEFLKRIKIIAIEPQSQIQTFCISLAIQSTYRPFILYIASVASFLDSKEPKTSLDENIVFNLSEIVDLEDDDETYNADSDKYLALLRRVLIDYLNILLYIEANVSEMGNEKVLNKVKNYSLFLLVMTINRFHSNIKANPKSQPVFNFDKLQIYYDLFDERFPSSLYFNGELANFANSSMFDVLDPNFEFTIDDNLMDLLT